VEQPREFTTEDYVRARSALADLASAPGLTLDSTGTRALEAWFLKPKAENADVFEGSIANFSQPVCDPCETTE